MTGMTGLQIAIACGVILGIASSSATSMVLRPGESRVHMNVVGSEGRKIHFQVWSELGGADSLVATVVPISRSGRNPRAEAAGPFVLRNAASLAFTVHPAIRNRDTLDALLTAVTNDGRRDEYVLEVGLRVIGDSVTIERSMPVRAETVIGTRRFRYGGVALVPIEAPEFVTEHVLGEEGTKGRFSAEFEPESLHVMLAMLRSSRKDPLPFWVLLDESGVVLDVRVAVDPRAPTAISEAVTGMLRRQLVGKRGSPDRLRGRPVRGWVAGTRVPH
jgi:hypothetical protein